MANDIVSPPGLGRRIAAVVGGIVVLAGLGLGVNFKIVRNTPNGQKAGGSGSLVQQWATSGSLIAKMNSSGSLVLSGTIVIGHRKAGSGYGLIRGTDGGRLCVNDIDGTGCTCFAGNNGVAQNWVGTAGECNPPDAI